MHLVDFPSMIFMREATYVTSCLFSCTSNAFGKVVYTKRNEFAPLGSNFFSF